MREDEPSSEERSYDGSFAFNRRSFLAGTGALGFMPAASGISEADTFDGEESTDGGESASDTVDRSLGRTWRDDGPWELLTQLTQLPNRFGGHPGERRAAELIADAFKAIGLENVTEQSFEMQRWTRGGSDLAVLDPVERSFETIALPYSPAGDVRADLIDVGYGTPEEIEAADVRNKIAVASTTSPSDHRFVHRMETFGHLVDAGARAFIFANHVPGQLPPTGSLRFNERAEIPGLGVSKETGAWLTDYAEQGGSARVGVDAQTESARSQNVHGTLGPRTPDEVVLLGHYDAHDIAEGALDNAAGVTVVATAARLLSRFDLGCRVRVAAVGSEELGLIGSEALADSLDTDTVRTVVNVDGAANARTLLAQTQTSDALGDAVGRVEELANRPISVDSDPSPYSDHWPFLRRSVPALHLSSESDDEGRGWGHTEADTRDKVDPRDLREHAMLTALIVCELTRSDPPRIEPGELCTALREQNLEPGMRATGIWPGYC